VRASRLIPCAAVAVLAGCGGNFDPYNELKSFRLLAVRADPPEIPAGGAAALEALIYSPDGSAPTYAWSWCPWRSGADAGFECAVSEADFKAQLADAGVPTGDISFDLGTSPIANLSYPLDPAVLAAACARPQAPTAGAAPVTLNCDQGLPISIGLTVTLGEKQVSGFKSAYLALDSSRPLNQNPVLTGLGIAEADTAKDSATALDAGDPTFTATLGKKYELFADVPQESAESFFGTTTAGVPPSQQREVLVITWFIEGGSTVSQHTTFYEGTADFDRLEHNTFTLPQPEELDRDRLRLVLVLRDNRGGVSWLTREILVERP
jgi:hypothetical protein